MKNEECTMKSSVLRKKFPIIVNYSLFIVHYFVPLRPITTIVEGADRF